MSPEKVANSEIPKSEIPKRDELLNMCFNSPEEMRDQIIHWGIPKNFLAIPLGLDKMSLSSPDLFSDFPTHFSFLVGKKGSYGFTGPAMDFLDKVRDNPNYIQEVQGRIQDSRPKISSV